MLSTAPRILAVSLGMLACTLPAVHVVGQITEDIVVTDKTHMLGIEGSLGEIFRGSGELFVENADGSVDFYQAYSEWTSPQQDQHVKLTKNGLLVANLLTITELINLTQEGPSHCFFALLNGSFVANIQFFYDDSGTLHLLTALVTHDDGAGESVSLFPIYNLSDPSAPLLVAMYHDRNYVNPNGCLSVQEGYNSWYGEVVTYPNSGGASLLTVGTDGLAWRHELSLSDSDFQYLTKNELRPSMAVNHFDFFLRTVRRKHGVALNTATNPASSSSATNFILHNGNTIYVLTSSGPQAVATFPASIVHYDVSYVLDSQGRTTAAEMLVGVSVSSSLVSGIYSVDLLDWYENSKPGQVSPKPVSITVGENAGVPTFATFFESGLGHLSTGQPIVFSTGEIPGRELLLAPSSLSPWTGSNLTVPSEIGYGGISHWTPGQSLRALAPAISQLNHLGVSANIADNGGAPQSESRVTRNHNDGSLTLSSHIVSHAAGNDRYIVHRRISSSPGDLAGTFGSGANLTIGPNQPNDGLDLKIASYIDVAPDGAPQAVQIVPGNIYRATALISLNSSSHSTNAESSVRLQVEDRYGNYVTFNEFARSDFPANGQKTIELIFAAPPSVTRVAPSVLLFESGPNANRSVGVADLMIEQLATYADILDDENVYEWDLASSNWTSNSENLLGDDMAFMRKALYINPSDMSFLFNGNLKRDNSDAQVSQSGGIVLSSGHFSVIGGEIHSSSTSKEYSRLEPGIYRFTIWGSNNSSLQRTPGIRLGIRKEGVVDGLPSVQLQGATGLIDSGVTHASASTRGFGSSPFTAYLAIPDSWADYDETLDKWLADNLFFTIYLNDALISPASYSASPSPIWGQFTVHRARLDRVYHNPTGAP